MNEETETKDEVNVVELSTVPEYPDPLENWQPLPVRKPPDPAKAARRKRAKAARKKNR